MTTLTGDTTHGLVVNAPWTSTLPKGVRTNCDAWSHVSQTLSKWGAKVVYGVIPNQNPHGPLRVVRDGTSLIVRKRQAYPIELFTNGARVHDGLKIAVLGNYGSDAEKQAKNSALLATIDLRIVRKTLPGADDQEFVKALTKLYDGWNEVSTGDAPSEPLIVALMEDCPMVTPEQLRAFLLAHREIRAVDVHKIGDRARDWDAAKVRPTGENGWTFACGLAKLRVTNGGQPVFTIKDRDHANPGTSVENAYPGFVDWEKVDPAVLKVVRLHPLDEGPLRRELYRVSVPEPWNRAVVTNDEMALEILRKVGAAQDVCARVERDIAAAQDEAIAAGSGGTAPGVTRWERRFPRPPNVFLPNPSFGRGVPRLDISVDANLKFKIAQAISSQDPEAAVGPVLRHLVVSDAGPAWAALPEVTPAVIRSVCGDIVSQAYSEMRQARRDWRDVHSNRAAKRYTLGILGPGAARTWGELFMDTYIAMCETQVMLGFNIGVGMVNFAKNVGTTTALPRALRRAPLVVCSLEHPGEGCVHTLGAMYGPAAGDFGCVEVLGSSSNSAEGRPFPDGVKAIVNPLASASSDARCVGILVGVRVSGLPAMCDVRSYDAVASAVRKSIAAPPVETSYTEVGLAGTTPDIEDAAVMRVLAGVGVLGEPWGMDFAALSEDAFLAGLRKASLRAKYFDGKELYFTGIDDFDPETGLIKSPFFPKFERKKPVANGADPKEDRMIAAMGPVDYFRSALVNAEAAKVLVKVGGLPPREERCDKAWGTKAARRAWGANTPYIKVPLDEAGADSSRTARHFRMYAKFCIEAGILDRNHPYHEFLVKISCSKLYSEMLKVCVDHAHLLSGHSGTWSIQTFMRLIFAVIHMELICGFKKNEYAVSASGDDMLLLALASAEERCDRLGRVWHSQASIQATGHAIGMKMTLEGPAVPASGPAKFLGGDEIDVSGYPGAPDDVINIPDFARSCVSLAVIPVTAWDFASLKGRLTHMKQAWLDRFCWEKHGVMLPVLGAVARHNYHRAQHLLDFAPGRVGAIRAIGDELWNRVESYRPVRGWLPLPGADHWLRAACADVWGIDVALQLQLEESVKRLRFDRDYDLSNVWELALHARYMPPRDAGRMAL